MPERFDENMCRPQARLSGRHVQRVSAKAIDRDVYRIREQG